MKWLDAIISESSKAGSSHGERRWGALLALSAALLLVLALPMASCASSQTTIGGYSVAGSPAYEMRSISDIHSVEEVGSAAFMTSDALFVKSGTEYGVSAAWYGGVSFDDALSRADERVAFSQTEYSEWTDMSAWQWRSGDKHEAELQGGVDAVVYERETVAELGSPNACYAKALLFPCDDQSVGVIGLYAYSVEQKEAQLELFDEVVKGISIG